MIEPSYMRMSYMHDFRDAIVLDMVLFGEACEHDFPPSDQEASLKCLII
jgi:hypothetical protein